VIEAEISKRFEPHALRGVQAQDSVQPSNEIVFTSSRKKKILTAGIH
jgi:hypothetical protein